MIHPENAGYAFVFPLGIIPKKYQQLVAGGYTYFFGSNSQQQKPDEFPLPIMVDQGGSCFVAKFDSWMAGTADQKGRFMYVYMDIFIACTILFICVIPYC